MTERIRPVELLRDNKGIYGIGFNEGYPFDQPPFADNICGYILPERALILRPDVIAENVNIPCLPAASLQMLPRGWRGGMEGALCDVISHVIMHRCGVLERPGDVGLSKEAR